MKVKELIEELSKCDPECEVILSKDAEGNSYSPADGIDDSYIYKPGNRYSRELWDLEDLKEELEDGYLGEEEFNEIAALPKCVILWPAN